MIQYHDIQHDWRVGGYDKHHSLGSDKGLLVETNDGKQYLLAIQDERNLRAALHHVQATV